jgi:hypothetical protein
MKQSIKIYLGAAGSVLLPTALQGCNGVCGSCGAGCLVAAIVAGIAGVNRWRREQQNFACREENHAKHED